MDKLDLAVTDSVVEKLLQPVRLRELFTEVLAREQKNNSGSELELLRVERELADARQRIDRLPNSVETGVFDANDDDLRTRLDAAKQDRAIATEAKMRIEAITRRATDVSPAKLVAFADFLSEALRGGEVPFRKAYLRMLIDWIDVTKHAARIRVRRSALRDQIDRTDEVTGKVPISIQDWRTRHDSNV
jgi:site-specific DNA recombinase